MTEDFKDVSGLLEEDVSKVGTDEKIDIGDKIDIVKPIIPIKPIRAPKFAAMRSMAEYPIPTPATRKEMFLNVIAGGISELPTPKTREEIYLAKICGMDVEIPIPLTRYEMYLYALSGGEWDVPAPVTRLEIFLYHNLGFEVETPEPVTREEIYWNGGQPQPTTIEGVPPLTFTAKRTGNLEDYTIWGNSLQSGTPTPDSPIEPEFVGERTENLFDPENVTNGKIGHTGTVATTDTHSYITDYIDITGANYVQLSQDKLGITGDYYITLGSWDENKNFIENSRIYTYVSSNPSRPDVVSVAKSLEPNAKYIRASVEVNNANDNPSTVHPMLNYGSTALPYEPYGYKIPILSGGQTKNIYLGQVPTTRRIKKLVLTGEENWEIRRSAFRLLVESANLAGAINVSLCTHYITYPNRATVGINSMPDQRVCFQTTGSDLLVKDTSFATVEDFKSYLAQQYAAGTPVTVWYVLAEPETGIVNEPLCRIGDYADSVDFSQAGVEIPVIAGENTVSVGTEIQPSNMSITYK